MCDYEPSKGLELHSSCCVNGDLISYFKWREVGTREEDHQMRIIKVINCTSELTLQVLSQSKEEIQAARIRI